MDESRVRAIARALCRSARVDPDTLLSTDAACSLPEPCVSPIASTPAWERFRAAAQKYCETGTVQTEVLPARSASRCTMAG